MGEKAVLESRTLRRSGEASVLGPFTTTPWNPGGYWWKVTQRQDAAGTLVLGLSSDLGMGRDGDAPVAGLEPQFPQHGDEGRGLTLFPVTTVPGITWQEKQVSALL